MNWGRIKTILIILFLFTDIFLALIIFNSNKKETSVSPEVIDAAVEILNSHGISIDKSVIPSKIPSAPILQADNVITDYDEFAKKLLGAEFTINGSTYSSADAKLTFTGDTFTFESEKKPAPSKNAAQNKIEKATFSRLKKLGFDVSDAKAVSVSIENGTCKIKIRDYYKKMPVFSSEINVVATENDIISLYGCWYNRRSSGQSNLLKSTAAILVDFAPKYDGDTPAKISSTELGYSAFDIETYHKSASLIPVNRIRLDSGKEYFMDARAEE